MAVGRRDDLSGDRNVPNRPTGLRVELSDELVADDGDELCQWNQRGGRVCSEIERECAGGVFHALHW